MNESMIILNESDTFGSRLSFFPGHRAAPSPALHLGSLWKVPVMGLQPPTLWPVGNGQGARVPQPDEDPGGPQEGGVDHSEDL